MVPQNEDHSAPKEAEILQDLWNLRRRREQEDVIPPVPVHRPGIYCLGLGVEEGADEVLQNCVPGSSHEVHLKIREGLQYLASVLRMELPFSGESTLPRQGIRQNIQLPRDLVRMDGQILFLAQVEDDLDLPGHCQRARRALFEQGLNGG